jgi:hypothetical protein
VWGSIIIDLLPIRFLPLADTNLLGDCMNTIKENIETLLEVLGMLV